MSAARIKIDKETKALADQHVYPGMVNVVNSTLFANNIPVGEKMKKAIDENLEDVRNNNACQGILHAREVKALTGDAAKSLGKGECTNTWVNLFGAVMNTAAFFAAGKVDEVKAKHGMFFGRKPGL